MLLALAIAISLFMLPSRVANGAQVVRPPEDDHEQNGHHGEHDRHEEAERRQLLPHLLVGRS